MRSFHTSAVTLTLSGFLLACLAASAQQQKVYQPTIESLDSHPLPNWYNDAKLGVMIVWGLYSVPGWAPVQHADHDFFNDDYLKYDPYAEWYYNASRIPGSPTEAYNREHYGATFNYYNFAGTFNEQSRKWDPDKMAAFLKDAGFKYVILTTKFHDGYLLWHSSVPNPDQQNIESDRDLVAEFVTAMRKQGLRVGFYYSGGYDWTFDRGPIRTKEDYASVKPQSSAYGTYADAQIEELIAKFHPSMIWNDIDWPKSGKPLQLMADFYNAVPDGVVDDRFGVSHSDFDTPEYQVFGEVRKKKWEETRGVGLSFGYNRNEGEAETIAPDALIKLLADIVSKNGNLDLGVGPEADGSISPIQTQRLEALGAWLKQNGEAIYGTRPWTRAEGDTGDATAVRFTQKDGNLYAILMGAPSRHDVLLHTVKAQPGSQVTLLGDPQPLTWKQEDADLRVQLPPTLPGQYAYVLRIALPH
jgi:alpha-L-fucosidase